MKADYQETSKYFQESVLFAKLPPKYKDKLISFFLEERHYMVDPSDVVAFLNSGKSYSVFEALEEVRNFSVKEKVEGILACKRIYPSIEWLSDWGEQVNDLCNNTKSVIFLTHALELEGDMEEEWYIVTYN